jgi:hypothetical protein
MADSSELIVHIPDQDGFGEKPGFDACLPSDVRYDSNLSPITKLIYAEIRALSTKHGFCYAKNEYFEKVFEIDKRTLQRALKQLSENDYIQIFKARNDVNGKVYRIITLPGSKFKSKNATKMSQKERQKCREKRDKNVPQGIYKYNTNNINLDKIQDSKKKVKNNFHNFQQREYPEGFWDSFENTLIKKKEDDSS